VLSSVSHFSPVNSERSGRLNQKGLLPLADMGRQLANAKTSIQH